MRSKEIAENKFFLLVVFVFLIFAFFSGVPNFITGNEGAHYFLTRALAEENTFQLDCYSSFDAARFRNHLYSNKPPGLTFLVLPFYRAFFYLVSRGWIPGLIFVRLFSALFGALVVGLVYLTSKELGNSEEASFSAALVTGFATLLFVYATVFWDHVISAFFVLFSLYLALRYLKIENKKYLAISAFCAGYLIFIHEVYAPISLIILGYLLIILKIKKNFRKAIYCPLPFTIPIILLGISRFICFGNPFICSHSSLVDKGVPYMMSLAEKGIRASFLNSPFPGLYGLLFSPSRGLFIYSPILLFALWGIYLGFKRCRFKTLFLGSIFIFHLLLISRYTYWHGGHCFGPRYLIPVIPVLAIFFAFTFDRLWPSIVYTLFSYSVAVHAMLNYLWLPSQVAGHGKTWIVTETPYRLTSLFDILPDFFLQRTANIWGEGLFLGVKLILLISIILVTLKFIRRNLFQEKTMLILTLAVIFSVVFFNLTLGEPLSSEASTRFLRYQEHITNGCIYINKGISNQAIKEFQKAKEIYPWEYKPYLYLGNIYLASGRKVEANREFLVGLNNRGVEYASRGEYEKAKEAWEEALKLDPENRALRVNLRKLKKMGY